MLSTQARGPPPPDARACMGQCTACQRIMKEVATGVVARIEAEDEEWTPERHAETWKFVSGLCGDPRLFPPTGNTLISQGCTDFLRKYHKEVCVCERWRFFACRAPA